MKSSESAEALLEMHGRRSEPSAARASAQREREFWRGLPALSEPRAMSADPPATVSVAGTLVVWAAAAGDAVHALDLDTGAARRLFACPAGTASRVVLADDRRTVFCLAADRLRLTVWSVADGQLERSLVAGRGREIGRSFAVSRDGAVVAAGCGHGAVLVWLDGSDDDTPSHELPAELGAANDAALDVSLDGARVVAAERRRVAVWNARTGERERTVSGHADAVVAVAITPGGRIALSVSRDGTARAWSTATGTVHRQARATPDARSAVITADARYIFVGTPASVDVWSLETGTLVRTLRAGAPLLSSAVSRSGLHAAAVCGGGGGPARGALWTLASGGMGVVGLDGPVDGVELVALSDDGATVAAAAADGAVTVSSLVTGGVLRTLAGAGGARPVALSLAAGNGRAVAVFADGAVRTWDAGSGDELGGARVPPELLSEPARVSVAPDGSALVVAHERGSVGVWPLAGGGAPAAQFETAGGGARCGAAAAYLVDGALRVVLGYADGTLCVFDAADGAAGPPAALRDMRDPAPDADLAAPVVGLAVSECGRFGASAHERGTAATVRVWDLAVGQLLHTQRLGAVLGAGRVVVSGGVVVSVAARRFDDQGLGGGGGDGDGDDDNAGGGGGRSGTLRAWDVESGELVRAAARFPAADQLAVGPRHAAIVRGGRLVVRDASFLFGDTVPAWYIGVAIDAVAGMPAADAARALAAVVPPRSWEYAPGFFAGAARCGDGDLLEALLALPLPEQPFARWSDVLAAAMASRSERAVRLVARKIVGSVAARNRLRMVPGTAPAWVLVRPDLDDGMSGTLARLVARHPAAARELLRDLPLVAADADVATGFGLKAEIGRNGMIVAPSDEPAPPRFWRARTGVVAPPSFAAAQTGLGASASSISAGGATRTGSSLEADLDAEADLPLVECGALPFPGLCGADSGIIAALLDDDDPAPFGTPVVRAVVAHKWASFGRQFFLRGFKFYVLRLSLIIAIGLLVEDWSLTAHDRWQRARARDYATLFVLLFAACTSARDVVFELGQSARSARARALYAKDAWKALDAVRTVLIVTTLVLIVVGVRHAALLLSILTFLKWLGLLFYLQPLRQTGPLVSMVLHIISEMRFFILVLAIAVIAVGNSLMLLVRDAGGAEGFSDPADALFTMFRMLLLSDFDASTLAVGEYALAVRVIFVLSMILVPIVLLNLLIALMSDSYERIQDSAEDEFQLLRARIVHKQEIFTPAVVRVREAGRPDWFPRHLQVLVPQGGLLDPGSAVARGGQVWQGVLHALKDRLDAARADVAGCVETVRAAEERAAQQSATLESRVAALGAKLDRVIAALDEQRQQ